MIRVRTVSIPDPLARANVLAALVGPGRPVGVLDGGLDGETLAVRFDDARTAPELIDALIEIERSHVAARAAAVTDPAAAAAAAARGLREPELDAGRIIETYL